MRLFQRKASQRKEAEMAAIAAFWQWWPSMREVLDAAIQAGSVREHAEVIAQRVHAVHRELEWELTPGMGARHALVVTSGGVAELRAVAARWFAAAPAPDDIWEYHDIRRSDRMVFDSKLVFDDIKLEVDQVRYAFSVDDQRGQIDVLCYHPGFAGAPEQVQAQVTYLTLDWLLGEDRVETWIGAIHWTETAPAMPQRPEELRAAVDELAARGDQWALMAAEGKDGLPRMAVANLPLRSARWPRFDTHLGVTLPYRTFNEGRLPIDTSLQALRDFEDMLVATVGADGTLVAHETGNRLRTLHIYVDSQSGARGRVETALPGWSEGRAGLDATYDPRLSKVEHLSG
ncbi:MAG TPA: hypothetical protein VFC19_30955 [Candidatus Limnocylindrales bacterium]|nr:hypothetical protein [Candidatus Limnocylindrales bacterium]